MVGDMKKHITKTINTILTFLFPNKPLPKASIFMEETWLERNTRYPFIKDWLIK
jgi:hypothetical protein